MQPGPKRKRNWPNRPGQAARAYRRLEQMAEAAAAAEAAEDALAAASRLPAATPVQKGGSTGSSPSAALLPPRPSSSPIEETEVDKDLQQAILDSLQPDTVEEAEPEPPATPTARASTQPATEEQPAGGSLWYL